LDQSDTHTRDLAGAISTDPEFQKWLASELHGALGLPAAGR
jgi:hypothetical protein